MSALWNDILGPNRPGIEIVEIEALTLVAMFAYRSIESLVLEAFSEPQPAC